ncbi:MAG: conjugal transfer protein TraX [Bacilli bacterium]|nr:conjugal transfer protein TraX [Bacilli bacterium]
MSKKYTFLSNFWIKIIAFITMTIDHIGWALSEFVGSNYFLVNPCRLIGRLALPLFCFMIVEGVIHTRHFGKYALRLGIMATIISIAMIIVQYAPAFKGYSLWGQGNIFIDLLLGALTIYLLRRKEIWAKLLSLLIVIISIISFIVTSYEVGANALIHWFPFFLRLQYDWLSIMMMVGFYFAYTLKDWALEYHESKTGLEKAALEGTFLSRNLVNAFSCGMLIVVCTFYYVIGMIINPAYLFWNNGVQAAAMFSGAFILLYNGKRGYNAKWFEYGSYLYYPLHLILIFGIAALISM